MPGSCSDHRCLFGESDSEVDHNRVAVDRVSDGSVWMKADGRRRVWNVDDGEKCSSVIIGGGEQERERERMYCV